MHFLRSNLLNHFPPDTVANSSSSFDKGYLSTSRTRLLVNLVLQITTNAYSFNNWYNWVAHSLYMHYSSNNVIISNRSNSFSIPPSRQMVQTLDGKILAYSDPLNATWLSTCMGELGPYSSQTPLQI